MKKTRYNEFLKNKGNNKEIINCILKNLMEDGFIHNKEEFTQFVTSLNEMKDYRMKNDILTRISYCQVMGKYEESVKAFINVALGKSASLFGGMFTFDFI